MTSLSTELEMLLFSTVLYIIQILLPAMEADVRNGLGWGLSNRSDNPTDAAAWGDRASRAVQNMAENLLPFACIVLIVQTSGNSGEMSALGALVFFYSQVSHALLYLAGITVLRSLAYFGGLIGMGMMIYQVV
ncbi:MAG: MAPEG family protein [Pseudomonadales bacterium]|nr:MAPEG family protein [Pseudomonadales bacterium]